MTELLNRAFKEASKLPEIEQNAFAKWVLQELETENNWEKIFAESEDILDKLADEAINADKEGRTQLLNDKSL
jgi:hypothetical protein